MTVKSADSARYKRYSTPVIAASEAYETRFEQVSEAEKRPYTVRVAEKTDYLLTKRNEAIADAYEMRVPASAIAEWTGLSRTTVYKIANEILEGRL